MLGKGDSRPEDRDSFRLRSMHERPGGHGYNLRGDAPAGYDTLSEKEKTSVAEFVEFLRWREEEEPGDQREHFYVREHDYRPEGSHHTVGTVKPEHYNELTEEDRFHVHEFINFLIARRA